MVTHGQVDVAERLTNLAMRVVLFVFVLLGVAVMTYLFVYCVMHDKSRQAQAISGYSDAVFVTALGTLMHYFFIRKTDSPGDGKGDLESGNGVVGNLPG